MYRIRSNNLIDVALYLLLSIGWALGGWLLVMHAFRLRHAEGILSELAAGYLLFNRTYFSNDIIAIFFGNKLLRLNNEN
jgi:hypothetical protein